jgi:competence ComEA-like helix-hairpin-helix protein
VLQWLNHASAEDFQNISGIGEQTAANIISFRQKNNGFRSIDQLNLVNGIGEKRVIDIVNYIQQSFKNTNTMAVTPTPKNKKIEQPQTQLQKISINQATAGQLETVSGIGPHLSQLIVDERAKSRDGFRSWNQLRNISGLGASRIELLQQHFTLE